MNRRPLVMLFSALLVVGVAGLCGADDGEWRCLFDGKTLDGWEQHGGTAVYKVEDGVIVGHSVPNTSNSFMCTKERFGDFELMFEVEVDAGLNSGVQIRSNIREKGDRVNGPQVEIEHGPGESGYIYGEATGRGWLSQDRSKNKDAFKNDDWNQYRVVAKGDNIKTWVNDLPIADLTDDQASKEGIIGLQVHGVGKREAPMFVRWRNIKIRDAK